MQIRRIVEIVKLGGEVGELPSSFHLSAFEMIYTQMVDEHEIQKITNLSN
jgi:hypothetical protein